MTIGEVPQVSAATAGYISPAAVKELLEGRLGQLAHQIHGNSVRHGWWETKPGQPPRTFGDVIALAHSELSEALEEFRKGKGLNEVYWVLKGADGNPMLATHDDMSGVEGWKPEGVPIEIADTIIRLLDDCAEYGIDIDRAVRIKMAYNETRPYRHGGKVL